MKDSVGRQEKLKSKQHFKMYEIKKSDCYAVHNELNVK